MVDIRQIFWLAGLLDGEGSFLWIRNSQARTGRWSYSAVVKVKMTDRDLVARVAELFGSKVNGPYRNGDGKEVYETSAHNSKAIQWMLTIYPIMGFRRQLQIKGVVTGWKGYRSQIRKTRTKINNTSFLLDLYHEWLSLQTTGQPWHLEGPSLKVNLDFGS